MGEYFTKLSNLLVDYKKVLIVAANNVGSNQLQRVRQELRGKAVLLMGKNTMIRKCIRENLTKNPDLEALPPPLRSRRRRKPKTWTLVASSVAVTTTTRRAVLPPLC